MQFSCFKKVLLRMQRMDSRFESLDMKLAYHWIHLSRRAYIIKDYKLLLYHRSVDKLN